MAKRELEKIIGHIEDAKTSVEEAREEHDEKERDAQLAEAQDTLERATTIWRKKSTPTTRRGPVRLEFDVRPRVGVERGPRSGRPNHTLFRSSMCVCTTGRSRSWSGRLHSTRRGRHQHVCFYTWRTSSVRGRRNDWKSDYRCFFCHSGVARMASSTDALAICGVAPRDRASR